MQALFRQWTAAGWHVGGPEGWVGGRGRETPPNTGQQVAGGWHHVGRSGGAYGAGQECVSR